MHRPKLANPITAAGIASSISKNNNSNSNNNKSKRSRQFSSNPAATIGTAAAAAATTNNESALNSSLSQYEQHSHSQLIDASIDLEHYISAMEARRNDNEPDVWAQLQQKESDILLAAELGKALLEKNEELVKQQEKLIEDYSGKIEVSCSRTYTRI